jgi:hypothetical protein
MAQSAALLIPQANRYERILSASKRARFDLERDVFRGRELERNRKYLPDGLSLVARVPGLNDDERRCFSQVQGRTYANVFGLVERFINTKVLELASQHALGDQLALEALVRFSDEELKHQEMFRRLEASAARAMPPGYRFQPDPDEVARAVLASSTWAVLALTSHIELFTLVHYKESIEPDGELSALFKDVLLHHFKEESQHALLDELEWRREDARLDAEQRDAAVDDLIALVGAVDGILQVQAAADGEYFCAAVRRPFSPDERAGIAAALLAAYRFQYIVSGVERTRFAQILAELVEPGQWQRIQAALAPLF